MARPVTLFTGQWADLPLEELCKKAVEFGYDGLELACWGDHFEVQKALADDTYCSRKRDLLEKYDLQLFSISNHLVGQAVLDRIDERHKSILPPEVWGDGDPAGVNERAIQEMTDTARAAQKLGVDVVNGFTGSSIWHLIYDFPPTPPTMIDAGFDPVLVGGLDKARLFDQGTAVYVKGMTAREMRAELGLEVKKIPLVK